MHLVITFNISYEVQFETDSVFYKSNTYRIISRKVNLKGNRVYIYNSSCSPNHESAQCIHIFTQIINIT